MLRAFGLALVIATLLATYVRTFVLQPMRVVSDSMRPTLLAGDHILVNRFVFGRGDSPTGHWARLLPMREVRRGDVVLLRLTSPVRETVKRCLGVPGDRLEVVDHRVRIGEEFLAESGHLLLSGEPTASAVGRFGPLDLGDGLYFCLGDHRDRSRDSRSFGPVPRRQIVGLPFLIYWSTSLEPPEGEDGWGKIGRQLILRLYRTRWQRSFVLVR